MILLLKVIVAGVMLYAGSLLLFSAWLEKRQARHAEAQRIKFAQIARANSESAERLWPSPSGPKGFAGDVRHRTRE